MSLWSTLFLLLLTSFLHQEGRITGFSAITNMVEIELMSRPKGVVQTFTINKCLMFPYTVHCVIIQFSPLVGSLMSLSCSLFSLYRTG